MISRGSPLEKKTIVLFVLTIGSILPLPLIHSSCCRAKRAVVTVDDVQKLIEKDLPRGSTRNQVITFLDSLKIDSLKVVRAEYSEDLKGLPYTNFDDKPEGLKDSLRGYMDAAILDVERSCGSAYGTIYRIEMTFYFGEMDNVIDYTVRRLGSVM